MLNTQTAAFSVRDFLNIGSIAESQMLPFVVVQEFLVLEVFIAAVGCDDLIHDVRHVLLHLQHAVVQNEKNGREDNDKDDCQIHEWCSFFGFRCEKSARVGRRILISLQLFD